MMSTVDKVQIKFADSRVIEMPLIRDVGANRQAYDKSPENPGVF
jgi:hypothetical protein